MSTECLHFAQLRPQRSSSRGHPGSSQKSGIAAKSGRGPGLLGSSGGCAPRFQTTTGILKLDGGDGCTTL